MLPQEKKQTRRTAAAPRPQSQAMKPPAVDTFESIGRRVCAAKTVRFSPDLGPPVLRPSCWHSATPAERSCFEWPPLWRIDCLDILGRIVWPQSIQPQLFALLRIASAGDATVRGSSDTECVGHKVMSSRSSSSVQRDICGLSYGGPQRASSCLQIRVATSAIASFPHGTILLRRSGNGERAHRILV